MRSDIIKWLIGVAGSVFLVGMLYAADSRWLRLTSFEEYQQAQITRENQAELRALERRILDVQSELQYGVLTPERKVQLEQLLALLLQQQSDLKAEL